MCGFFQRNTGGHLGTCGSEAASSLRMPPKRTDRGAAMGRASVSGNGACRMVRIGSRGSGPWRGPQAEVACLRVRGESHLSGAAGGFLRAFGWVFRGRQLRRARWAPSVARRTGNQFSVAAYSDLCRLSGSLLALHLDRLGRLRRPRILCPRRYHPWKLVSCSLLTAEAPEWR